jgi:hypothetical protein
MSMKKTSPPPLVQTSLKALLACYMIEERFAPFTWIVGDDWLVYDGKGWILNADEPVPIELAEALVKQAGGCILWEE